MDHQTRVRSGRVGTRLNESNVIRYRWPRIFVPHTSLTRYIVEKFLFYSNQIFLTDAARPHLSQFTYKHILLDSLRTAQILRGNKVTADSTVAIVGDNSYELVCTLFAALLLEATIVLVPVNAKKAQILSLVKQCSVSYVAVVRPKPVTNGHSAIGVSTIEELNEEFKKAYLLSFGASPVSSLDVEDCLQSVPNYSVDTESALNAQMLGLQRPPQVNHWQRTRLIVPTFKANTVGKLYYINEFALMSQLTYATLPQTGFEWNINDTVLNQKSVCTLLGVLELLVTCSVGAQLVLTSVQQQRHPQTTSVMAQLIDRHRVTAAIVHSSYLLDLIKSSEVVTLAPLDKLLYTGPPIHRNIVAAFRKKFSLHNCRYGFFIPEASGFAALEVLNFGTSNTTTSVTPLPSMEFVVVCRETGTTCSANQLGKLFVRSPYCARTNHRARKDGWVFSGHVGFFDHNPADRKQTLLQVIDHYCNFVRTGTRFISRSLVEALLLSHQSVARAVTLNQHFITTADHRSDNTSERQHNHQTPPHKSRQTASQSSLFRAFVTVKQGQALAEQTITDYLNGYLNDDLMQWTVAIVSRLERVCPQQRIRTRRLGSKGNRQRDKSVQRNGNVRS